MPRLIVQSLATGKLLVPGEDGQPEWKTCLRTAGIGVFQEFERAAQLIEDWCDTDDRSQVIDLDRIGTLSDYTN